LKNVDLLKQYLMMLSPSGPVAAQAAHERLALTLLTQRLTEVDATKLGVFSEGAAHVVVVAGSEPDTVPGLLDNPRATLHVLDAANDVPGDAWTSLRRPLQYEAFTNALSRIEQMMMRPRVDVPSPVTASATTVLPSAAAAAKPARDPALALGAGYRLHRWPSADVLRGHRYNTRLASFMSTRHVQIDELAQLSNVSRSDCIAFVGDLLKAGLLDVKSTPLRLPAAAAGSASAAPEEAAATARKRPAPGLFSKIRHSLGMR
jgi:hypothetical protein